MGGKAKPTKHTTKEINMKHHASKMKNGGMGGGSDGKDGRMNPKAGKRDPNIVCQICLVIQPGLKCMKLHYENKHFKEDWEVAVLLYKKTAETQEEGGEDNQYEGKDDFDDEPEEDQNEVEEESKEVDA